MRLVTYFVQLRIAVILRSTAEPEGSPNARHPRIVARHLASGTSQPAAWARRCSSTTPFIRGTS